MIYYIVRVSSRHSQRSLSGIMVFFIYLRPLIEPFQSPFIQRERFGEWNY